MPPMLPYYSNLVLREHCARQHSVLIITLTECAECTGMRYLLTTNSIVLSSHRHNTGLQLGYLVIMPVSAAVQKVMDQIYFPELV